MEHMFIAPINGYLQDLTAISASFRPEVLIGDFGSLAMTLLAEQTGLPLAMFGITALTVSSVDTAPFGLGLKPSSSPLGRIRNRALNLLMRTALLGKPQASFNRGRAGHGLAPVSHLFLDHQAHASDNYLQSTVPVVRVTRGRTCRRQCASSGRRSNAGSTPSRRRPGGRIWLRTDRWVLVTQGTVATDPNDPDPARRRSAGRP